MANFLFGFKITLILCIIMMSTSFRTAGKDEDKNVFNFPNGSNTMNVSVNNGEEFTIKLKGNPTTGYAWYLKDPTKLDKSIVKPTNLNKFNSADYVSDQHPEGMVGVGGSYLFKFEAVSKTDLVDINFVYKRSWETTNYKEVKVNLKIA